MQTRVNIEGNYTEHVFENNDSEDVITGKVTVLYTKILELVKENKSFKVDFYDDGCVITVPH